MSFILPSVRVLSMWKRIGDTSVFKCSGFPGSIPVTERALTVWWGFCNLLVYGIFESVSIHSSNSCLAIWPADDLLAW